MIDLDNKKGSSCLKVAFNNVPLVVYCGKSGTTSQTLEGSISEIKSPKLKDQHKNRHVTSLFCVKKIYCTGLKYLMCKKSNSLKCKIYSHLSGAGLKY